MPKKNSLLGLEGNNTFKDAFKDKEDSKTANTTATFLSLLLPRQKKKDRYAQRKWWGVGGFSMLLSLINNALPPSVRRKGEGEQLGIASRQAEHQN